jgi:hypothetical protein
MEQNGINNTMNFQDFKRLSQDEREYFVFDTLCRVDARTAAIDRRFALKWVERVMQSGMAITLIGVLGAILAQVGIHISHTNG